MREKIRLAYQPGAQAPADGLPEFFSSLTWKCAAVLMPLIWWQREWHLVFTRRTETVEQHKGQVSFPGGACEVDEPQSEQTALREAREEVGIQPADVRLLGCLNQVLTITGYRVTPVVGVIPWPYRFACEPAEVERVFTIPLAWLAQRQNWEERPITPEGLHRSFMVIYYQPYQGEILWGVTAKITHNFLAVLGVA